VGAARLKELRSLQSPFARGFPVNDRLSLRSATLLTRCGAYKDAEMDAFEGLFKKDPWSPKGVKADEVYRLSQAHRQGKRPTLEDRLLVRPNVAGSPYHLLVGVYDGHFGERCADFVSSAIGSLVADNAFTASEPLQSLADAHVAADAQWLQRAKEANPQAPWEDGSTGTSVLLLKSALYVAHTGDCRAVLCNDGKAVQLTRDHKPDLPDELERSLCLVILSNSYCDH